MSSQEILQLFKEKFDLKLSTKQADDYAECLQKCAEKYPDKADAIKRHACELACVPDNVLEANLKHKR